MDRVHDTWTGRRTQVQGGLSGSADVRAETRCRCVEHRVLRGSGAHLRWPGEDEDEEAKLMMRSSEHERRW
jgi:hypothetical protein